MSAGEAPSSATGFHSRWEPGPGGRKAQGWTHAPWGILGLGTAKAALPLAGTASEQSASRGSTHDTMCPSPEVTMP